MKTGIRRILNELSNKSINLFNIIDLTKKATRRTLCMTSPVNKDENHTQGGLQCGKQLKHQTLQDFSWV
jgi:hypothetical protein